VAEQPRSSLTHPSRVEKPMAGELVAVSAGARLLSRPSASTPLRTAAHRGTPSCPIDLCAAEEGPQVPGCYLSSSSSERGAAHRRHAEETRRQGGARADVGES
jgi:hypothetical protein